MKYAIRTGVASALAGGMMTAAAGAASATGTATANAAAPSSQAAPHEHTHHGGCGRGMHELAALMNTTPEALAKQYPQQTSWQIALKAGKLDALKKAVLESAQKRFDAMQQKGFINADERAKMEADLKERLAKIDGKNVVILGRPGYKPAPREHKPAS